MKYIVFKQQHESGGTLLVPIVFPDMLVHSMVAEALLAGPLKDFVPDSAGFLSSLSVDANCHGESESLKLKANPERDIPLLKMADYGSMHE